MSLAIVKQAGRFCEALYKDQEIPLNIREDAFKVDLAVRKLLVDFEIRGVKVNDDKRTT
jgi:hypothetical protein